MLSTVEPMVAIGYAIALVCLVIASVEWNSMTVTIDTTFRGVCVDLPMLALVWTFESDAERVWRFTATLFKAFSFA